MIREAQREAKRTGRRRPSWLSALALGGLVSLLPLSGCHCGKKSDEEILRERIDATPVYLYVATKIAITKADTSPEVAAAKKELLTVLEVLDKTARSVEGKPIAASPAPAPTGSAAPAGSVIPASVAPPKLEAADYAKLAMALWALRSEGQEIVRSGREDKLTPVLPVLLRESNPGDDVLAMLDLNTEHALFFTAFFLLKFHPKSPAPVPEEILLYEAWNTKSEEIKLDGFAPLVQAMKAIVYGGNELCDLSAKEGAFAEASKGDAAAMAGTLKKLSGGESKLEPKQADTITAAVRALAHGAAGSCFLKRDEKEKALDEIQKLIDAAHDLGVPRNETALPRAYLFYQKDDHDAAKKCLEEAKDDPATDPETKKEIEEVLPHIASNDDNFIEKKYGKLYFDVWAVRLVYRRLDRAGVFDLLKETPLVRTLDGYTKAASGALGSAKQSIPSFQSAKDKGKGLFDKFTK
jgi:hypothetical protein